MVLPYLKSTSVNLVHNAPIDPPLVPLLYIINFSPRADPFLLRAGPRPSGQTDRLTEFIYKMVEILKCLDWGQGTQPPARVVF
jgi:hypothetical protein